MRILVFRSGDEPARLLEGVNFSQTSHASTTESESSRTMSAVFGWLGGGSRVSSHCEAKLFETMTKYLSVFSAANHQAPPDTAERPLVSAN